MMCSLLQAQTIKVGENYGDPSKGELTMKNATPAQVISNLVNKASPNDIIEIPGHTLQVGKGVLILDGTKIAVLNPKTGKSGNLGHSRALARRLIGRQFHVTSRSKYSLKDYGYTPKSQPPSSTQ